MRLLVVLAGLLTVLVLALPARGATDSRDRPPLREVGYGQIRYRGLGPEAWHWRYVLLRRQIARRPDSTRAIQLASATYGVSFSTLYRKAWCESKLGAYPNLFQFIASTWASTPFARFSVFDVYANALAAGWMHARGRGGEWVCR